jgi:putative FmdB family regulatory protein
MPLYAYTCSSCGDFHDWRSMSACNQSVACPRCGTRSRRAVAAPTILGMDASTRIAHMRNEKSAHEPKVVRRDHRQAHGHHHHAHASPNRAAGRLGSNLHQSSRRWMIGH